MAAPESESKELIDAGEIEKRLAGYRKIMGRETSLMTRAVHTARAMQIARKYVEQNVRYLVDLQGSELGFLTDKKDGEKYTAAELVDPLTSALVLGVPLVGGCAMVLAKRLYITSPGWEHRFRETEDMSWPEIRIGEIEHIDEPRYVDLPKEKQYVHRGQLVKDRSVPGTARVECWARVVYGKIEHQVTFFDRRSTEGGMDERLIIKVNRGMTDDAVIGKARARLYKALWRQAMGVGLDAPDDEGPEDDGRTVAPVGSVSISVESVTDAPQPAAGQSQDAAAGPAEPAKPADYSVPQPGTCAQFAARIQHCKTVKELNDLLAQYQFQGEVADQANRLFDLHKRRVREVDAAREKAGVA